MTDIPSFYVREETVAGPLYFWPLPAVRQSRHDPVRTGVAWFDDDGNQAEVRGGYVVTQVQTSALTAMWPESPKLSGYRRKVPEDRSPIAEQLWSAAPGEYPYELTRDEWNRRCENTDGDGGCGTCSWCAIRSGMYERVMTEPTTGQRDYDVSGLEQLDIHEPDPAPDRTWQLDSPSLAGFYPRPAHHQFPGQLSGVFDDIAEAVKAAAGELGIPVEVKAYSNIRSISVTANIVWDQDLPYREIPRRTKAAREENAKRRQAAHVAVRWYRTDSPSDLVTGASKADALRRRDEVVAKYVAKLLPPHTVACDKCRGLGYVR